MGLLEGRGLLGGVEDWDDDRPIRTATARDGLDDRRPRRPGTGLDGQRWIWLSGELGEIETEVATAKCDNTM